jgi:hypothetical protein
VYGTGGREPKGRNPVSRLGTTKLSAGSIGALDPALRLAFEMTLNEEFERRAMEGELALLEEAWREAEEVASIADGLIVPAGWRAFVDRHRRT